MELSFCVSQGNLWGYLWRFPGQECPKAAVLLPRKVYGLWNIDELRTQPEVQQALVSDPAIEYFMEAYNVYFYGIKAGHLYVFDAETDELDSLGPIEPALETLMDELESVRKEIRGGQVGPGVR